MNDKDRFDAEMKLSDFWIDRVQSRRNFEWKIALSLFGVLAAATIYLKGRIEPNLLVGLLVTTLLLFAIFWLRPIWLRHERDWRHAFYHKNRAEHVLRPELPAPKVPKGFSRGERLVGFLGSYAVQFQFLALALLACCIFLLASDPDSPAAEGTARYQQNTIIKNNN